MNNNLTNRSTIRCGKEQDICSIAEALSLIDNDGTIFIDPGVYKEHLDFTKKVKIIGVTDSIVKKTSNELPIVILDADKSCTINAPVEIEGVVFTHKESFSFEKLGDYINGTDVNEKICHILEQNSADEKPLLNVESDAILKNIGVLYSQNGGISFSKCSAIVEKSIISHSRKMGVLIKDSATPQLVDCFIHNNIRNGIVVKDDANPRITGCKIYNQLSNGIFVKNKAEGTFERCDIYGNKLHGIALSGRAAPNINECRIYENGEEDGDCSGITILETASPKVNACDVFNNAGAGVKWFASQSLDEWAESSQKMEENDKRWHKSSTRISFSSAGGELCECHIHDNKENGVIVCGRAEPKIEKCEIHDNKTIGECFPGVIVGEQASPQMADCKVYSHLSYGIWLQSNAQGVYENCGIYDNEDGVCVEKSAGGSFKLCHINDNKKRGVLIKNEASPLVEECKIYNHPNGGILLTENAQGTYLKCRIYDNEEQGVRIQDSAKGLFNECNIHGNKKRGVCTTNKSSPKFEMCDVHDNVGNGKNDPGFFFREDSSPTITGCDVHNQKVGILLAGRNEGKCIKCNIHNNRVGVGAVSFTASSICECQIHHNNGNGIVIREDSTPKIIKCVIHDNNGEEDACYGIVIKDDAKPDISECEIYNHRGYGICENGMPKQGINCNIHDNGEENLKN